MVRPTKLAGHAFTGIRGKLARIVEHKFAVVFITGLILFNAVILGLDTSPYFSERFGGFFLIVDKLIIFVFCAELALKMFVYRWAFFRDGWNVFDFIIVGISLAPTSGPLSVMRVLRVFRVMRLISVVPQMRRVVSALLLAIPGMASIIGVLAILFYVFAILATEIFGASSDPQVQALFGTLSASLYSLFQVMTLEGWSEGIAGPTMEVFPWAWAFFVPFIFVTSFAVLNLFIGIIVDAMNIVQEQDIKEEEIALKKEISLLRDDIAELKSLVKSGDHGASAQSLW